MVILKYQECTRDMTAQPPIGVMSNFNSSTVHDVVIDDIIKKVHVKSLTSPYF
jgi:hypothetical protein